MPCGSGGPVAGTHVDIFPNPPYLPDQDTTAPIPAERSDSMEAKGTFREVIQSHNLLSLATVDSDGLPCVRSIDFAAGEEENVLYAITRKDSRKVRQIRGNGRVAFSIDHDCPTWNDLQNLKYVKGSGTAAIIEDPAEMQKAFGLLLQKFPFLKDLPGDPADFVGLRLELKTVLVTDNTIGFGHTETIEY